MADETKTESKITAVANSARHNAWKFFGALFMEEKNGVQAASMTKVLTLTTYCACLWLWLAITGGEVAPEVQAALEAAKVDVPGALKAARAVPDEMLYTLWGLLGISGGAKVAGIVKGNGHGSSQPGA